MISEPVAQAASPRDLPGAPPRGNWFQRIRWNASLVIGGVIVMAVILATIAGPWLYPGDPRAMVANPSIWPFTDPAYPLGTDVLGRDVTAQLFYGAQVSLLVGFFAALLSLLIGITVGAAAGYAGGWVDDLLVRFTELFQTIPPFILVIVLVVIGESQINVIAIAIGIASWPTVARLVRAQFRSLRNADYVMAARCLGYSTPRIVMVEIFPNAMAPIVVTTTIMMANAILMEAGLSFLNLGDANAVSWGGMIGDARELLRTEWYLIAVPGLTISLVVLGLNLFGNGLNDALNPRLKQ